METGFVELMFWVTDTAFDIVTMGVLINRKLKSTVLLAFVETKN